MDKKIKTIRTSRSAREPFFRNKIPKIKLYYDNQGNTLNVWFDDPKKEHICEETGEEIILVKDKQGKVIGFEKLNYLSPNLLPVKNLPVEVMLS